MTLQIVVPGTFTTPGLPELGIRGVEDTFSRDNSESLGSTESPVRPWVIDSAAAVGGIVAGTAYLERTEVNGNAIALVESFTSDGYVEMTVVTFANIWQTNFGLAFRGDGLRNHWRLEWNYGLDVWRVVVTVSGVAETAATLPDAPPLTAGDVLGVQMDGPGLQFFVNGTVIHTMTDSRLQDLTQHGWYDNRIGRDNTIDNFRVTPA